MPPSPVVLDTGRVPRLQAGGSTFVKVAQANGATLSPWNSNGNPLEEGGSSNERIPFWDMQPYQVQLDW